MNTHELLEMASLDALGLLDPDEREAFERAFRAAHPSVQAQIRREQLRFSQLDEVLPNVEPPLGLRARVLNAVREAMQTVSARKAASAAPALRPPSGVSRFWRIGAVGALAACVVLGFGMVRVINDTQGLTDAQRSIALTQQFQDEFSKRFQQSFFNADTRFVSFRTDSGVSGESRAAKARLVIDPSRSKAELFVQDLPGEGEYAVDVIDAAGNRTTAVITFTAPKSGFKANDIDLSKIGNAKQLLIRLQGASKPILSSDGLATDL